MQAPFSLRVAPHAYGPSGARVTTCLERDDYTLSGDGMLRFSRGATTSSSVTITTVNNCYDNPDRLFFILGIHPGMAGNGGAQSMPTGRFPVGSSTSTSCALGATWHGRKEVCDDFMKPCFVIQRVQVPPDQG